MHLFYLPCLAMYIVQPLFARQIYKMSSVWMRIILPADVTVTEESPQHNFTLINHRYFLFRLLSCRSFMMYRNGCPTLMLSGVGSKQPEQNTNIAASLYSLSFSTVLFPSNPGIRISIKSDHAKYPHLPIILFLIHIHKPYLIRRQNSLPFL